MPKVVSRNVVSSSEQAKPLQSARAVLRSYYCLCGDFVLVMQGKLERLPRRKTDGSYIIRSMDGKDGQLARKFKLNAQAGKRILISRDTSNSNSNSATGTKVETRQTFCCSRCKIPVGYQVDLPPVGSSPFLYILKGSMSEMQGRIPHDAFDGEEKVEPQSPTPVLGDEHPVIQDDQNEDQDQDLDLDLELDLKPNPEPKSKPAS